MSGQINDMGLTPPYLNLADNFLDLFLFCFHAPANNYDILFLSFLLQPSIYDFPCQVICTSQYSANELDILTLQPLPFNINVSFFYHFKHFSSITVLLIQPYQCQFNTSQLLSQTLHSPISFLSSIKLLYQLTYMNILWF